MTKKRKWLNILFFYFQRFFVTYHEKWTRWRLISLVLYQLIRKWSVAVGRLPDHEGDFSS